MIHSEFGRWILGIENLPKEDGILRLAWERPFSGWLWVLVVLLAVLLAIWSYRRLDSTSVVRMALGTVRFLLLILVAILIAGPMLVLPRVFTEPDLVVVLVDRSRSMQVKDDQGGQERQRQTRDDAARAILATADEEWRQPGETRRIIWLGFGESVMELATTQGPMPVDLGEADGWQTRLTPAIEDALRRTAGRPLAGIVVLSDGRTDFPPNRELIRRLTSAAAEVHVFPLGSRIPIGDTAVARVESPRRAFARDSVPIAVRLESRGRQGPATIELVDEESGTILAAQDLAFGESAEETTVDIVLTAPPSDVGTRRWSVRVSGGEEDLVPENNIASFTVELVDRPLRVLYVEGYPRWEYRYLKNLMVREPTIESSVMLLSADRDFAQEGNAPIARLPQTAEEFSEYDLIVLGDLPAGFLSDEQQTLIRDQVAMRGGGLLFIGGARSLPSSWEGRPLAELFPFTGPFDLDRVAEAVTVEPTETATRLGVFQFEVSGERGWPAALTDRSFDWPLLHWVQRIEPSRLKPTADVLAEAVGASPGDRSPLVLSMRYGAGQIIYVATDEIWRWRYGRGELIPEQFWVQLLRLLGREAAEDDLAMRMRIEPEHTQVGRPVRITVEVFDFLALPDAPETVRVDVINADGTTAAELELAPTSLSAWGETWVPERVGDVTVRIVEPSLMGMVDAIEPVVHVTWPEQETRMADADHELLDDLAKATSGAVYSTRSFSALTLPNRSFTTERPISERIWTSPLAFLLLVLLVTLEWTGRRLARLD